MSRRKQADVERSWYDAVAKWSREDRAAALKVLTILHDTLPDNPAVTAAASEKGRKGDARVE